MHQLLSAVTGSIEWPYGDIHKLFSAFVEARDKTLRAGKHNIGIRRVRSYVATLTAANLIPILSADHAFIVIALDGDRGIVLLRAVDVIGPAIIGNYVIGLRCRVVVLRAP